MHFYALTVIHWGIYSTPGQIARTHSSHNSHISLYIFSSNTIFLFYDGVFNSTPRVIYVVNLRHIFTYRTTNTNHILLYYGWMRYIRESCLCSCKCVSVIETNTQRFIFHRHLKFKRNVGKMFIASNVCIFYYHRERVQNNTI